MLLGDAAGLVDPFTGEGIGNAMVSAKYAVQIAKKSKNERSVKNTEAGYLCCLLYTSPSPRDKRQSRMPSSA